MNRVSVEVKVSVEVGLVERISGTEVEVTTPGSLIVTE